MDNLHTIDDWITHYHEGILKDAELEQFLEILKKDPSVRAETALDKELNDFLEDRDLLEFRKFLEKSHDKKYPNLGINLLLIAASLLFLLALAGGWIHLYPGGKNHFFNVTAHQKSGKISPADNRTHPAFSSRRSPEYPGINGSEQLAKPLVLASSYDPLPYLEGLVEVVTRAEKFSLLAPGYMIRIKPGEPVLLKWESALPGSLSLEVINNKGKRVAEFKDISGGKLTLETKQLKKGLYYWKFLQGDNLVCVGKVTIRN
ncbi:MAG: hypothetical protein V1733_05660 [bacterium]